LHLCEPLCERELCLELADVLHRNPWGEVPINITVAPAITVAVATGVAVANSGAHQ
jgi:hypothetical protein